MKYNWKKKIPQGEGQIGQFNFPESKTKSSVSKSLNCIFPTKEHIVQ